jgi:hypothetical protein
MKTFEVEAKAAPLRKDVDNLQILLMKQAEPALCWFLAWFNLQP